MGGGLVDILANDLTETQQQVRTDDDDVLMAEK